MCDELERARNQQSNNKRPQVTLICFDEVRNLRTTTRNSLLTSINFVEVRNRSAWLRCLLCDPIDDYLLCITISCAIFCFILSLWRHIYKSWALMPMAWATEKNEHKYSTNYHNTPPKFFYYKRHTQHLKTKNYGKKNGTRAQQSLIHTQQKEQTETE